MMYPYDMIDSRERNSADGSLVQKARRQVEIFHSQGTGGRSFQVVRASQWSSSRATDCGFDNALTDKPHNSSESTNGNGHGTPVPAPRLSLRRSSDVSTTNTATVDMERLSFLCRRLHDETMSQGKHIWNLHSSSRSPSPPDLEDPDFLPELTSHEHQQRGRSNSNEFLPRDDAFTRESKVRRSLQIGESGDGTLDSRKNHRPQHDLISERARRFEPNGVVSNGVAHRQAEEPQKIYVSTKSFTPIVNNDFVKNDPNHPSKQQQQTSSNSTSTTKADCTPPPRSSPPPPSQQQQQQTTSLSLQKNCRPVPANRKPGANNRATTTVLLIPRTSPAPINGVQQQDSSTLERKSRPQASNGSNGKPVKKVEFCKTELHFASDSGKVNVVETDSKPPPSNKFRRRRRNRDLVLQKRQQQAGTAANSSMPLLHFGDSSYEKYIFGGQGKPPPENHQTSNGVVVVKRKEDHSGGVNGVRSTVEIDVAGEKSGEPNKKEPRERTEPQNVVVVDDNKPSDMRDSYESGSFRIQRRTSTTFLEEETVPSANVVSKVDQGLRNVQLHLGGMSPLLSDRPTSHVQRTVYVEEDSPPPRKHESFFTSINTSSSDNHNNSHQQQQQTSSSSNSSFSNLESFRLVKGVDENKPLFTKTQDIEGASSLKELMTKLYAKKTEEGFKFQDFKRTRDKKLLEIKEALDASRRSAQQQVAEKKLRTESDKSNSLFSSSSSSQVTLKDLDKYSAKETVTNPVLLKVLNGHKPILARLENDRNFNSSFRSHLQKTKDDCDSKPKSGRLLGTDGLFGSDRIPVYENIFDAISDGPLYENFKFGKHRPTGKLSPEPKSKFATSGLLDKKARTTTKQHQFNSSTLTQATEASKNRAKSVSRSTTPLSNGSKSDSESKSRSTSKSRESSLRRYNKEGRVVSKETDAKRKVTVKSDAVKTVSSTNSDSLKKKKPVEVVYQTAVYNMKNEKLSKQSATNKPKDTKGPRLINDFICGSKLKRPAVTDKKIKATVASQNNTSKRKETSTTIKR